MTFAATANCILYQGARPVFADVWPDTLNVDPEQVADRVTSKTRDVLPVDYSGHPADLDPILKLAEPTTALQDQVIVEHCESNGFAVFRGAEQDVLDR